MTVFVSNAYGSFRSGAAACSPARISPILDTAILLVVSICVQSVRMILTLV